MDWIDVPFLALTYLGSGYAHVAVAVLCAWWISPRAGVQVGLVFAASWLLNWWIKDLVGYPRPFELGAGPVSNLVRATAVGTSWPSGHTQNTTAVWSFLALTRGRPRGGGPPRAWLWVLAAALVTLVAATRLVLGVHVLEDVLGGLAVGLAVGAGGTGVVRWHDRLTGRREPRGGG